MLSALAFAQPNLPGRTFSCTSTISVFPYLENFEASAGNWTTGGSVSSWIWGTPAKTVISGAGQGSKSWITGGLSSPAYNNGESSHLQSPCFDFTTLIHPRISFKIFWETERKYDGATLGYSIDGGTSWNTLGSVNSVADCLGENWYNNNDITYLGHGQGWSGNIQSNSGSCLGGNGSGGWLTAAHDLTPLAGQASVMFRFQFGAGTTCNAYDGFAIDQVSIFEAPPNTANFTYTCKPGRTVDFTSTTLCSTGSAWDFGDLASGANNTSSSTNPTHIFSAAGTYSVTLTSTFATGAPSSISKSITVLDVTANIDQPILCGGTNSAQLSVTATGSSSPYTYLWNTTPPQNTAVITGIGPGNYSVTVSSGTACAVTTSVVVTEPPPLVANPLITPEKCTPNTGEINANVTGGTPPYQYTWSNGATSDIITAIPSGIYSLQVKDSRNCITIKNGLTVPFQNISIPVNLGRDTTICPGQKITLAPGNFSTYLWQDNSALPVYTVSTTGRYTVQVTDATGCTGTGSIFVTVDCPDIFFPSGFTPGPDGRNDFFGPAGNNLGAVKNYELRVFDRYGLLVFYSNNPYNKWDGKFKTIPSGNATYVWMASYTVQGKQQFKKGTVTVIR